MAKYSKEFKEEALNLSDEIGVKKAAVRGQSLISSKLRKKAKLSIGNVNKSFS